MKQAESRADESRAALLPDLEGYVQYQNETTNLAAFGFHFPNIPIPGFVIPTFVGPFGVLDARATVNQTVFDFSAIRRFQAAKVAVEATKADNEGTRDQVTDQVARAYLAGLRAQASVDTARRQCGAIGIAASVGRNRKKPRARAPASKSRAPKCSWRTTGRLCWWPKTMWTAPGCNC